MAYRSKRIKRKRYGRRRTYKKKRVRAGRGGFRL